jgi:hypothetical protein
VQLLNPDGYRFTNVLGFTDHETVLEAEKLVYMQVDFTKLVKVNLQHIRVT